MGEKVLEPALCVGVVVGGRAAAEGFVDGNGSRFVAPLDGRCVVVGLATDGAGEGWDVAGDDALDG